MSLTQDRGGFLGAISDAPDDDTPRLVYADWLDERDEADRAEDGLGELELALARVLAEQARAAERREGEYRRAAKASGDSLPSSNLPTIEASASSVATRSGHQPSLVMRRSQRRPSGWRTVGSTLLRPIPRQTSPTSPTNFRIGS